MKAGLKLNALVASLEAIEETSIELNPEQAFDELQEAQIALEGYQDLLTVQGRLTKAGAKLDEQVVGNLLSLASPRINKDPLLSTYSEESVADKAKDFGKWLLEKIKALITWIKEKGKALSDKIKKSFGGVNSKIDTCLDKMEKNKSVFEEKKTIELDNEYGTYSVIYVDKKLLTPEQIVKGVTTLMTDLPEFMYSLVKESNTLDDSAVEKYIKGLNKVASDNRKLTNSEGIELHAIPNTNFYFKVTDIDEQGNFHTARIWGAEYIKEILGDDHFPQTVKLEISPKLYEDIISSLGDIRAKNIDKFAEYVDKISARITALFEGEVGSIDSEDHAESLKKFRAGNSMISDNLATLRFAGACATLMIYAVTSIIDDVLINR